MKTLEQTLGIEEEEEDDEDEDEDGGAYKHCGGHNT